MRKGRQKCYAGGGDAEQEERNCQLDLSPVTALDGHEGNRAKRSCNKGKGEDQKCIQRSFQSLLEWKEYRWKHQHRGLCFVFVFVVFRRPADHHADGDFLWRNLPVARIDATCVIED